MARMTVTAAGRPRDGAHGQGHGGHEHVGGFLAAQDARREGQGRQAKDGPEQDVAEACDLAGQGRGQFVGLGDHGRDAADFSAVAGAHDHARGLAVGDQGGGVGHVAPVTEDSILWQKVRGFAHGHGFAGQSRFVHAQILDGDEAQVGGHLVARAQNHDISGDQFGSRHAARGARSDDHRLGDHGIGQRFERPGCLGLLDVADNGIDQDHADDDA